MSDIANKFLPDLGTIKKDLKQSSACKWNINDSGIKIFFDVTGIGEMARLGSSKSTFGVGISLTAMVTNKVLNSVNHVGFILSDGTIIHATTNRGVIRESGKDIINDTKNYVVANVGGNESDLISKYNQLKKTLYIDKDSYDWKGIVRQVPLIGKLLGRLNFARENKPYRFYCSELVANLLVRCGVISYNELVSLNEKMVGLDKYDEVDPTKLFLMIKSKAKLCPVVCDADKDLKKENIMTKSELKRLIKEVLVEQNALTTLQISTVGGGTTLLLYKGDARGSELSSDKHYKTPTKFKDLIASLNTTGGMTSDESIKKILKKLTPAQLKELVREKIVVSDKVSIDEASINEVQGYVFGPMETPNNWISTNAKPKMKNGTKKWVVSAADFQKAFPNIQMKELPTNPSKYSDYYIVDNEGDLISYSQTNIGSGLD
jgi:hypothetical protein